MVKIQFNRNRTLKKVRTQTQNQMWKEADGKASTDKKTQQVKVARVGIGLW
jgi:hypothetical protein